MTWKIRDFVRIAVMIGLSVCLVVLAGDAWSQRRGGGMHARPNVSRQGPARNGSFNSNRNQPDTRRDERPVADRSPREDRQDRRDPGPDRMDARRVNKAERGRGADVDQRRSDDRRDDRNEDRPVAPERVEERRENRRDYYDDRRDDRRQFARGVRYSSVWWTSNSCRQTIVVVQDGYSYYQCNGAWFGRTYYGGEVTYTVIDAPQGY
jgi:hypothetical protein